MKRIGIFGGTFNPIHKGHLKMAEASRKEYKLSCVYFIPCGIPPHKTQDLLPAKLRYSLVKSAIKEKKYFKVSDIEIKKEKKAYTVDTIKKLQKMFSVETLCATSLQLYFLIGSDEFEKLHTWKKANELAKMVTFLVLPRRRKIKLPKVKDLKWYLVHTKPINISSSKIRGKIRKNQSVKNLLPAGFVTMYKNYGT